METALQISSPRSGPGPPFDQATYHQMLFFDADGDGDTDILTVRSGKLTLLLNSGNAVFVDAPTRVPQLSPQYEPVVLVPLDLENDGDVDVFYGADLTDFRVLVNDGQGKFTDGTSGRFPPSTQLYTGPTVAADLDGDGDQDLAGFAPSKVFLNDGKGRFSEKKGALSTTGDDLFAGDFDGDGDPDLLATGYTTHLFANDGKGMFSDVTAGHIPKDMRYPTAVINLHRHVLSPWIARLGRVHRLEFYSRPGYAVGNQFLLPMLATGEMRIPLPPFGTLWLTPSSLVPLPAMLVNPTTGKAVLSLPIPATRSLLGTTLASQALILDGLQNPAKWRLTNVVADRLDF